MEQISERLLIDLDSLWLNFYKFDMNQGDP